MLFKLINLLFIGLRLQNFVKSPKKLVVVETNTNYFVSYCIAQVNLFERHTHLPHLIMRLRFVGESTNRMSLSISCNDYKDYRYT